MQDTPGVTTFRTLTAKHRKALDTQAEVVAETREHDGKVAVGID